MSLLNDVLVDLDKRKDRQPPPKGLPAGLQVKHQALTPLRKLLRAGLLLLSLTLVAGFGWTQWQTQDSTRSPRVDQSLGDSSIGPVDGGVDITNNSPDTAQIETVHPQQAPVFANPAKPALVPASQHKMASASQPAVVGKVNAETGEVMPSEPVDQSIVVAAVATDEKARPVSANEYAERIAVINPAAKPATFVGERPSTGAKPAPSRFSEPVGNRPVPPERALSTSPNTSSPNTSSHEGGTATQDGSLTASIRPADTPLAKANRQLRQAKKLYSQGNPRAAEQQLRTLLAGPQDHWQSRHQLASWLMARAAYQEMASVLASTDAHSMPLLRELKAHALLALGRQQQALALLQTNLPPVAEYQRFHTLRAGLLQHLGYYGEALLIYAELVEITPDQGALWAGLGISLDQAGHDVAAQRAFSQALADPGLSSQLANYAKQRVRLLKSHQPN